MRLGSRNTEATKGTAVCRHEEEHRHHRPQCAGVCYSPGHRAQEQRGEAGPAHHNPGEPRDTATAHHTADAGLEAEDSAHRHEQEAVLVLAAGHALRTMADLLADRSGVHLDPEACGPGCVVAGKQYAPERKHESGWRLA